MSRNKIKKHLEKYFKAKIILNIIEQIILNVPSPTKCISQLTILFIDLNESTFTY